MKTEEADSIKFYVVYIDSENPDPKPPRNPPHGRWSFVKFESPIIFNIENIVKLAKATDPRTSSLAIFHDSNERILIWGLIDQGNRYFDYVNYEIDKQPERPGLFQASIEAPGYISAYLNYQKIAELRVDKLVRSAIDVFKEGVPIRTALQEGIDQYIDDVIKHFDTNLFIERQEFESVLIPYWITTLCRLILRIKSHRHGGAILISPLETIKGGLDLKYPIDYFRLNSALVSRAVFTIKKTMHQERFQNI